MEQPILVLSIAQFMSRRATRLISLVVLFSLLAGLLSGFSMLRNYEFRTLRLAGHAVAFIAEPVVNSGDKRAILRALRPARGVTSVQRAEIYNAKGHRVANWDRGTGIKTGHILEAPWKRVKSWASRLVWPSPYRVPIIYRGKTVGFVLVRGNADSLGAYAGSAFLIALFSILIAMLIVPILTRRYARSLSGPLEELRQAADAARNQNDFSRQISPSGIKEIDQFSRTFNQILADIDEWQRDISTLSSENVDLAHKAEHDPLTGLGNRSRFDRLLGEAITVARKADMRFALLIIDLDDFKAINDEYGHVIGDQVLTEFGVRLGGALRASDQTFRIGGDEFAVLLTPSKEDAPLSHIVSRISAAMEKPVTLEDGRNYGLPFSIGMARFPSEGDSAEALLEQADRRMYSHKRGENAVS